MKRVIKNLSRVQKLKDSCQIPALSEISLQVSESPSLILLLEIIVSLRKSSFLSITEESLLRVLNPLAIKKKVKLYDMHLMYLIYCNLASFYIAKLIRNYADWLLCFLQNCQYIFLRSLLK